MIENYKAFLTSRFGLQWKRIGVKKRAGLATPLFSVYSKNSIGIGEIPDLKLLIDMCVSSGISILQLLPMNDVGFNFRPYDAESSFAIDPMYLSIANLRKAPLKDFLKETAALKKAFPVGKSRVNYAVRKAKLDLLRKIFLAWHSEILRPPKDRRAQNDEGAAKEFENYRKKNVFWLEDYAHFRVLKDRLGYRGWEEWPEGASVPDGADVIFYQWLQWQIFEQFIEVKKYAKAKKVLLMGDLPFLVSRDSADVWARRDYFKLNLASGAPPDLYFAKGQRWGMPPYDWDAIAAKGYDYLIEKLKYAENFYDLFRIDHFVGIFRIWTIPCVEPQENAGACGAFDPPDENRWEEHGRKILDVVAGNTRMLPCAEDLGVVPACSYRILEEYGIPGMDIQRWARDWGKTYDFLPPEKYRVNSVATLSTHDMLPLCAWWKFDAGTVDEEFFRIKCRARNLDFEILKEKFFDTKRSGRGRFFWKKDVTGVPVLLERLGLKEEEAMDFVDLYRATYDEREKYRSYVGASSAPKEACSPEWVKQAFFKIHETASIFSVQLLQDWLSLDKSFKNDEWDFRINVPGTMSDRNWTLAMPFSLEKMKLLKINKTILEINHRTRRN